MPEKKGHLYSIAGRFCCFSVLCPRMSLIQMNTRSMSAGYRFCVWSGHFHGSNVLQIFPAETNRQVLPDLSENNQNALGIKPFAFLKSGKVVIYQKERQ